MIMYCCLVERTLDYSLWLRGRYLPLLPTVACLAGYTDEPVLPCGGLRYILLESSLRTQYVDRTRLPLNAWELDDGGGLYTAPLEKTR